MKPHLRGLNLIDASFRCKIQLLWVRVGHETNFMLMR